MALCREEVALPFGLGAAAWLSGFEALGRNLPE